MSAEGFSRHRALALLVAVLAGVLALLVVRGLDLGFTGDLLDYAYHYEREGTFGGMHWLVVEHWQRHLFAGVFSAPFGYLFPRESAPWYIYAFLSHFAAAMMTTVLANAVLRGRFRWVAVAAGLMFAFHTLHVELNFEFPTSGHGNSALALSLISLWLYLKYVRQGRTRALWRDLSLVLFVFAFGTYEQTALFFLLHPVIAWFEDRANGLSMRPGAFVARVARDSWLFPAAVVAYLFLLRQLFPGSSNLNLNPGHILSQVGQGLAAEFAPGPFWERIAPAFTDALVFTIAAIAITGALLMWLMRIHDAPAANRRDSHNLDYLVLLGIGSVAVSIAGVAPTKWSILENPRLIYPSAVGVAYLITGLLAWLALRLPATRIVFALVVAVLVGTGFVRLLQTQDDYLARQAARQRVLDAIHDVIPDVSDEPLPYLLIYSEANPTTDLWLYAQDNRFRYAFDRMYDVSGMAVDAIYPNLDPALAPTDNVPGSDYNGQFIVAEPEGIYSPLKPYEPIDPATLVIVHYDADTGEATVVDAMPPDVLASANIIERAPVEWATNRSLIRDESDS